MKKRIKILLRLISWGIVALLLVCVGLSALLHYVSRQTWFREQVLSYTERALEREVQIGKLALGLTYVRLEDVQISEKGGFEEGVFLSASNAQLRFSLWHLLHLHFRGRSLVLQDVHLNIVYQKDDSFNFSTLGGTEQIEENTTDEFLFPFDVSFRTISVDELDFTYTDLHDNSVFAAHDLTLQLQRFNLDKPFSFSVNSLISYTDANDNVKIPVSIMGKAYLGDLDFSKAYLEDIRLSFRYQNCLFNVQGRVNNFESPLFNVHLSAEKVSSAVLSEWVKLPKFQLKQLDVYAVGQFLSGAFDFSSAKIQIPGVLLWIGGTYNYEKNTYQAAGQYKIDWANVLTWLPNEWKYYKGEGNAQGTFNISNTQAKATAQVEAQGASLQVQGEYHFSQKIYTGEASLSTDFTTLKTYLPSDWEKYKLDGQVTAWARAQNGKVQSTVTIHDGAFFHPRAGHFSKLSLMLSGKENSHFKTGQVAAQLSGNLNQGPFELQTSVKQYKGGIDVDIVGKSKRIALPPLPPEELANPEPEFVEDTTLEPVANTSWRLPPIHLTANLKVDSLDAPYLYATDLDFTADIAGLTPKLDKTQGAVKLTMGNGTILDLYRLTNANPLTKVLFMSVNVVGKVFNSLNVLSVLNGLGKGMLSVVTKGKKKEESTERMVVQPMLDENGQPVELLVPYTDTKHERQQHFDKFETEVKFAEGVASVRKGTFVSEMMSMRLDGTTDFNTGVVDMQVHAAPGRHEVTGVMPLTINISGTVQDPKGSMSVLSSVTSLVTQGITRNVVSRNVHKGLKGFINLFRKKDKNEESEPLQEDQTSAVQEEPTMQKEHSSQAQDSAVENN